MGFAGFKYRFPRLSRHLQNPSWFPLEAGHHEGFCKEKWRMLWE